MASGVAADVGEQVEPAVVAPGAGARGGEAVERGRRGRSRRDRRHVPAAVQPGGSVARHAGERRGGGGPGCWWWWGWRSRLGWRSRWCSPPTCRRRATPTLYRGTAQHLADGDGFVYAAPGGGPPQPSAEHPPLFPLVLGGPRPGRARTRCAAQGDRPGGAVGRGCRARGLPRPTGRRTGGGLVAAVARGRAPDVDAVGRAGAQRERVPGRRAAGAARGAGPARAAHARWRAVGLGRGHRRGRAHPARGARLCSPWSRRRPCCSASFRSRAAWRHARAGRPGDAAGGGAVGRAQPGRRSTPGCCRRTAARRCSGSNCADTYAGPALGGFSYDCQFGAAAFLVEQGPPEGEWWGSKAFDDALGAIGRRLRRRPPARGAEGGRGPGRADVGGGLRRRPAPLRRRGGAAPGSAARRAVAPPRGARRRDGGIAPPARAPGPRRPTGIVLLGPIVLVTADVPADLRRDADAHRRGAVAGGAGRGGGHVDGEPVDPAAVACRRMQKKIGILVVAYNAATTLAQTLDRIPADFVPDIHEVLVGDDASQDSTHLVGARLPADVQRPPAHDRPPPARTSATAATRSGATSTPSSTAGTSSCCSTATASTPPSCSRRSSQPILEGRRRGGVRLPHHEPGRGPAGRHAALQVRRQPHPHHVPEQRGRHRPHRVALGLPRLRRAGPRPAPARTRTSTASTSTPRSSSSCTRPGSGSSRSRSPPTTATRSATSTA